MANFGKKMPTYGTFDVEFSLANGIILKCERQTPTENPHVLETYDEKPTNLGL